jgi:hypothetical protein
MAREDLIMKSTKLLSRILFTTALAGGLMFVVGTPAQADHDYGPDCANKLNADKARIDHDAARHGNDSPQVQHDVARMDQDRQWCRDHKADWDHSSFDVGIYIKH